MYISHLHTLHYKSSTIKTHLSAISFMLQTVSLPNHTKTFTVQKQLQYFQKTDTPPSKRKPINVALLTELISSLTHLLDSRYERYLYSAIFACMYHGALRVGEVCYNTSTTHTLQCDNLKIVNYKREKCLRIQFVSHKHSHHSPTPLLLHSNKYNHCPVLSYSKYTRLRVHNTGPAFLLPSGSPVLRRHICHILNQSLTFLGYNHKHYNTHSFRIGKTTDLVSQGHSYPNIALIGRWKSNAFLNYIKPNTIHTTKP